MYVILKNVCNYHLVPITACFKQMTFTYNFMTINNSILNVTILLPNNITTDRASRLINHLNLTCPQWA